MIDGVFITPLKRIPDERGEIMHMLRNDWEVFAGCGEIYFSCINENAIKAWRKHSRMTLQLAVPSGNVRLVLIDDRVGSSTENEIQQIILGVDQPSEYALATIPPGIWSGFQGLGPGTSIVANCGSIPHDPDEAERLDRLDPKLPYVWPV